MGLNPYVYSFIDFDRDAVACRRIELHHVVLRQNLPLEPSKG